MQCCGSRPPLAGRSTAAWPIVVVAGLVLAAGVSLVATRSAGALPHLKQCENNIDDDAKTDFETAIEEQTPDADCASALDTVGAPSQVSRNDGCSSIAARSRPCPGS